MYLALDRRFSTVRCLACGLAMVLPRLGVAEIKARYPYLFAGPHIGRHVPRAGSRPSPSFALRSTAAIAMTTLSPWSTRTGAITNGLPPEVGTKANRRRR
jgi:hypothetical protein